MAKFLILAGVLLVALGMLLYFFPNLFSWFGKLPGDIHRESERGVVFIPITSMVVISLVLTLLINLFKH